MLLLSNILDVSNCLLFLKAGEIAGLINPFKSKDGWTIEPSFLTVSALLVLAEATEAVEY